MTKEQVVIVHPETAKLEHLEKKTFSQLGIKERQDIENWVLAKPEVLGEPLLVVTTEFHGFDKSDKRLDVLALDKNGKLVVIELKREATNTLAELQAIRYAAFCSTMTFKQAVEARAKYSNSDVATAESVLRKFVEDDDFSSIDNQPRIILVAGAFDDVDLTSSVLWLRTFRLDIRCVELAPYRLQDNNLLLVCRTLIPLPEAADIMVKIEEKVATEQGLSDVQRSHQERNRQIVTYFRRLLPARSPTEPPSRNYMQIASGYSGIHFEWWYRSKGHERMLDVALHFETPLKDKNRSLCEGLRKHQGEIEKRVGEPVIFESDWGQKWAALYIERAADPWSEALAEWSAQKMALFIEVLQPLLNQVVAGSNPS